MPVENQVMAIFSGIKGFLDDIAVDQVQAFRDGFLEYVTGSHAEIPKAILAEKKLSDETDAALKAALTEYKAIFSAEDAVLPVSSDSGE
jgi:F-type H+-transporting ATPase subunit alpha